MGFNMRMLNRSVLLEIFLFTTVFGARVFQKVTEESKKNTNSFHTLNTASKETAELLGISEQEAKKQILEVLSSNDGLAKNGSLLAPTTAFCPREESSCSLQRLIPIHPAGFPNKKFIHPTSTSDSPDCEGFLEDCYPKCPNCDKCNKFRTIDGTCNNLGTDTEPCQALWGSRNQALRRLVQNNYDDELSVPTGGQPLSSLPSPRKISNVIHANPSPPTDHLHTHLLMQFGQFVDHDLSFTPEVDVSHCCMRKSDECFPFFAPADDPHFPNACLNFSRSAPKCHAGMVREQFNTITSYLDGSQIYGSDEQMQNHLRTNSGGLLRVKEKDGEQYLPLRKPCPASYGGSSPLGLQFQAGDLRVTENPGLQGLHTLFMREHNRIAELLDTMYSWDDERIYQEARRIVIAQLQNIVYKEFLPIILGPDAVDHAVNSEYDNTEDATIANSFATAAYRFGHSLITGLVDMLSSGSYDLTTNFFDISEIWTNGKMDDILGGASSQSTDSSDRFIHDSVRNQLFDNIGEPTDLAARNIQRGRDHGLPTFHTYRQDVCEITSSPIWQTDPASLFNLYGDSSKLELFPGGLLEEPVTGGLVGPTFHCLIKKQFQSLKDGDRFFFTHQKNTCACEYNCNRFTTSQQMHIMNRSLKDILCDNTGIADLQNEVLKKPTEVSNPVSSCPSSSSLNVGYLVTPTTCVQKHPKYCKLDVTKYETYVEEHSFEEPSNVLLPHKNKWKHHP